MIVAFMILSALLTLLPMLIMVDGVFANGVALAIGAIGMLTVALTLPTGELNRFYRLIEPAAIVSLFIPCAWMLLQVMPLPARVLANPIWASASTALDQPFLGAISLDIGATLLSLAHYCAGLAAAFMTATVTLGKDRAESVLSLLTAVAALIAVELIGFSLGYLHLPGFDRAEATDIAVFGFILSCATTIRVCERLIAPHAGDKNAQAVKVAASISIAALLICLSAILMSGNSVLLFAALLGAGILIGVLAIRKWRLGLWGQAGIGALVAVATVGFFAIVPAKKDADPIFALSTPSQNSSQNSGQNSSQNSPIERMLSDTKWVGSGAGSFRALLPIYRDTDEVDSSETSTAAATIAVEMGQPFLWACVIAVLFGAWTLFRRALLRRDYIFSGAGAGCMVALLVSLFANSGSLGLTASLMIGALCGLAFAQSKSASTRELEMSGELYRIPNHANDRTAAAGFFR